MSVLAGACSFGGHRAHDAGRAIAAALPPLAPDGVSVYADEHVAMGFGAFDVWVGEASADQPLQSGAGLVATWDGRLDNRDDLLLRLGEPPRAAMGDAAIAVAAFERWDLDGLRALVGEWSLAIWDRRRHVLHLARDYMGVRPLYYAANDRGVLWSSRLGELARRSDRVDALSEAFVARFMTLRLSSDVTPYDGIHAVPTATCVSFRTAGTETRRRFWQLAPGTVRYRDPREYEEHLRALWQDAVGARLGTAGTVWAELSGGLDSSSVVCMADRLIKAGRVPARAIRPISHVTLESPEGDERRFIAEVEAQIGVRSEIVGVEEHQDLADDARSWVTPFGIDGVGLACDRLVLRHGGRLVLSGRVGDVVTGCEPDNSAAIFDDLGRGDLIGALSNARAWSRACRKPFGEIAWHLARLSKPGPRKPRPAHAAESDFSGFHVLTARLRPLAVDDEADVGRALSHVRLAKCEMARLLLAYTFTARLNIPERLPGITHAYPYTHRPLVDYMLAIPGEELSAPGQSRSLMRRAFEGFVPARVLRRTSKGYYPPAMLRSARLQAVRMGPADDLEVVQRGWIDPTALERFIRQLLHGGGSGIDFTRVLRLEQWLRSRHRRAPADIPQRKEVNDHAVLNP